MKDKKYTITINQDKAIRLKKILSESQVSGEDYALVVAIIESLELQGLKVY